MSRIREVNGHRVRTDARYVLYWMTSFRRTRFNFALDSALGWCRELGKPLVVLEALRAGYRYASDRIHRFVLDGMADNAARLERARVAYYPYVEPEPGAGKGLLEALAADAAVVVTDDWPSFFVPHLIRRAGEVVPVRLEAVDGNGILPLHATDQVFPTAHSFRRYVQRSVRPALGAFPKADPLARKKLPAPPRLPARTTSRWPRTFRVDPAALPIDHGVTPTALRGGENAGRKLLRRFVRERLAQYTERRNQPEEAATSGLSPYLHFGHVSPHEAFRAVARAEGWTAGQLSERTNGSRSGFWGMSESAEAFVDQLLTWRELGFHTAAKVEGYDQYEALPPWARATLADHEDDPREHVYPLEAFEDARTHDPLWNAAQMQLRREGTIHNYLRMLWGKKILEWSASPREALRIMLHLNDRWAFDGRDPNSVSGILWCLGRYDRAWGPERPIFGKIRYMSSANTARKVRVRDYVRHYAPTEGEA